MNLSLTILLNYFIVIFELMLFIIFFMKIKFFQIYELTLRTSLQSSQEFTELNSWVWQLD